MLPLEVVAKIQSGVNLHLHNEMDTLREGHYFIFCRTLFDVGQVPSAEPVLTSGSPADLLFISQFAHRWAVTRQSAL